MGKLDAAYDIDPIFHKMSQKFDEGGAKGLLLVNLGVASDGCRIILDSKEDVMEDVECDNTNSNNEDDQNEEENVASKTNSSERNEGEIDITEISSKLQELLLCSPLHSIQLVPQLEELRVSYAALEEEGFTDDKIDRKLNVSISYYQFFFGFMSTPDHIVNLSNPVKTICKQ